MNLNKYKLRTSLSLIAASLIASTSSVASSTSTYTDVDYFTSIEQIENTKAAQQEQIIDKTQAQNALAFAKMAKAAFVSVANIKGNETDFKRIDDDEAAILASVSPLNENVVFPAFVGVTAEGKEQYKFIDENTGLMATVLLPLSNNDNRVILAFAGSDTRVSIYGRTERGVINSASVYEQVNGGIPADFKQAKALAVSIKSTYPSKDLIITGTSLGGGLAQYAAMLTDSKAYGFNALGLGSGTREDIMTSRGFSTQNEFDEAANQSIINVNLEGEALTSLFGWYMPAQLGEIYTLPFCKGQNDWYEYLSSHSLYLHNIGPVIDNLECLINQ
ncbi:hypothetical protein [uncultured Shewanella sp.]|uniref:hypothetical protein n=1 Tax=uncultured Shewanella sp. TaxID=173975 RepID=UPI0026167FC4|nr:hypothetical protein [uncultured Shewanella sp.]